MKEMRDSYFNSDRGGDKTKNERTSEIGTEATEYSYCVFLFPTSHPVSESTPKMQQISALVAAPPQTKHSITPFSKWWHYQDLKMKEHHFA